MSLTIKRYRGGIVQEDLHEPSQKRKIMKHIGKLLALALLAAAILSGCVIVPAGGWYGDGWRYHPYPYGYYYHRGW